MNGEGEYTPMVYYRTMRNPGPRQSRLRTDPMACIQRSLASVAGSIQNSIKRLVETHASVVRGVQ